MSLRPKQTQHFFWWDKKLQISTLDYSFVFIRSAVDENLKHWEKRIEVLYTSFGVHVTLNF